MEKAEIKSLRFVVGILAAAGVPFLLHGGIAGWSFPDAPVSLEQAGWLEHWIINHALSIAGEAGLEALCSLVAAILAYRVFRKNGGFFFNLLAVASLAILLPGGPGLFFLPVFLIVSAVVSRKPLVALVMCFFWPLVQVNYFLGGILVAIEAVKLRKKMSPLFFLAPIFNPLAIHSLLSGSAFISLAAVLGGFPYYTGCMMHPPVFFLAAIWAIAVVTLSWGSARELSIAVVAASAGMFFSQLSALPPFFATTGTGNRGRRLIFAVLSIPVIFWLSVAPPRDRVPVDAVQAIREIPAGSWTLRAPAAWRGLLASQLDGVRLVPEFESKAIMDARKRYPRGPVPPFLDAPDPGCDVLLVKPDYPEYKYSAVMQKGWRLVSAGNRYALFAREGRGLEKWLPAHSLKVYNPYSPPPKDFAKRRESLREAVSLLRREPDFFQALRDAGRMETDFGLIKEAVAHLRRAVSLRPRDAKTANDLGVALQSAGSLKEAEKFYTISISLNPSELLPRLNLANLYLNQKRFKSAEEILVGIIVSRPRAYIAYRRLAQAYAAEGMNKEAREILDRIPPDSRLPEDSQFISGADEERGKP